MSDKTNEHQNWIRYWAVSESRQINKYSRDVDKVLADAKKIAAYVLDKPQTKVITLAVPADKQGGEA